MAGRIRLFLPRSGACCWVVCCTDSPDSHTRSTSRPEPRLAPRANQRCVVVRSPSSSPPSRSLPLALAGMHSDPADGLGSILFLLHCSRGACFYVEGGGTPKGIRVDKRGRLRCAVCPGPASKRVCSLATTWVERGVQGRVRYRITLPRRGVEGGEWEGGQACSADKSVVLRHSNHGQNRLISAPKTASPKYPLPN